VRETIAIVGASVAGGTAAATLREEGFDGRLVLIGEEDLPPYERPPLSKEYLRGEHDAGQVFLRSDGWYDENDIAFFAGARAERIDPAGRAVILAGGEAVPFDRALITTGARNRRIPAQETDLAGVLELRTLGHSDRIREAAFTGGRFVLVGMGFIGAEVAASLRQLGCDVTVVEIFETALFRLLGPVLGRVIEGIHHDHGVRMLFSDTVQRFEGDGRVEAVVTSSGRRIECDFVVVGVGVQPNVEIAAGTELRVGDGIAIGPALETNVSGIFAAGDVALHDHPRFGPIRVEHFDNALRMGQAAARNMLGANEVFDDPHWFWSDQYDVNIQMAGVAASGDDVVFRGSIEDRSFCAFFLSGGVLLSAVSVNRARDVRRAMPLIRAGARPDPEALRDQDVDLRTLLPPRSHRART
jgi:3-phenylpropionate/trans-cinnamate dioxygenase ferredoxin reductase component